MSKKLQTNYLRQLQEQTLINCLQAGGIIYIQYKNKLKESKNNDNNSRNSNFNNNDRCKLVSINQSE